MPEFVLISADIVKVHKAGLILRLPQDLGLRREVTDTWLLRREFFQRAVDDLIGSLLDVSIARVSVELLFVDGWRHIIHLLVIEVLMLVQHLLIRQWIQYLQFILEPMIQIAFFACL